MDNPERQRGAEETPNTTATSNPVVEDVPDPDEDDLDDLDGKLLASYSPCPRPLTG